MSMPSSIAGWCTLLFFLVFGITAFVPFAMASVILGILALGVAIFTLIGK